MHAVELAELAATFARGTLAQLALRQSPDSRVQQNYWLTARYRHEGWMRELSRHRDAIGSPGTSRRSRHWHDILPVMQEILLSEPLARVIAYHASLLEHLEIDCDFSPLATGVLAAHVEARNRCLHLIVFGPGLPVESAVGLNRLRRSLESYTDELLSCLPPVRNCGLFCFEPQQLIRTQAKLGLAARQPIWTALCAMALSTALWQAVRHELDWRSGSARLNYQLSQHVLRLSNPSSFDSFGIPHASSIGRLLQSSPEAAVSQNEIYALFSADPFAKASLPRFFRSANGPRRVDP